MCVNDCKRFAHLEPEQYRSHVNDTCECGQRRFEVKQTADGLRILPRKVMYWFGVGAVVRDRLFTDPSFCKHRTTGRDEYFYPSDEARRLAAELGCEIRWRKDVSIYEIGLDWAQMFTTKVHSTGFLMLRWVAPVMCCATVFAHTGPLLGATSLACLCTGRFRMQSVEHLQLLRLLHP